jgi:hypothetical protein
MGAGEEEEVVSYTYSWRILEKKLQLNIKTLKLFFFKKTIFYL